MTGPKTRPLPTVGKQACDRLLSWLIRNLRLLTELCDKVESVLAKKPAPEDAKKVEIHLELTRLLSEGQYSIKTLGKLQQSPNWISDVEGHLSTMMHVQEATDNIRLIQEQLRQLRQLRELSLADIDTSTPQDLDQATVDEDFSETQTEPTVQQRWAPQHSTQAGSTPTRQLHDEGANNMNQISPVKRKIGRTKSIQQVASYGNVHVTRREWSLQNAQNRAQPNPTPEEMPANGPDWYQASNDNVHASRRARLLTNAQNRAQTIPTPDEMPPNGPDWYQDSKTLVKSPEELQENSQDAANVSIDTIAYRKHLPVHHDCYLEESQAVIRHKGSEPTEPIITISTAAEMKMQVFQLTQRMMQAEADGRIDDACALQGLIRASDETLKTCSKTVNKRTSKEWPPNPQGNYYLDNPQKIQLHAFISE
ncbi:hypothetical protein SARC_09891 [Sphaeroforma arctica JP610]|uniref:Uncharacterized protein n=1 Tax=Sphaeroforma arctica JP610 TaxID=667725 RepID=A0A0L0FMD8_9EUKA|nr:hypothetical protein SARC_09891 [Sphaeroforma arctica JP610]KNC77651.1 hypothetical protein SARC_09891 [Sphaeroforma arctica JP610]|eukprot:XP_014151553.1 hypothetical protein SARC_09891 [Sphaeroforma arctica JP610]